MTTAVMATSRRVAFLCIFAVRPKARHNMSTNHEWIVLALGYLSLLIIWTLVSVTALVLCLLLTNPLMIGPVGVTLWFVVFLLAMAGLVALGLYVVKGFLHIHKSPAARLRYSWRQGLLVSGYATGMLALSSLRQFSLRDAILWGLLLVIVEIYVRLRWP